jgi:hypothetical protein
VPVGDRILAVVALERASALALVDLTDPAHPSVPSVAGIGGLAGNARLSPEGVGFATLGRRFLVLTAYELSGAVGIFEVR